MNHDLSPWARGALTEEQRLRIRLHLAPGHRLVVMAGASRPMFNVRVTGDGRWVDWSTSRRQLWETIIAALEHEDIPLEPDEQWAKTREAINNA